MTRRHQLPLEVSWCFHCCAFHARHSLLTLFVVPPSSVLQVRRSSRGGFMRTRDEPGSIVTGLAPLARLPTTSSAHWTCGGHARRWRCRGALLAHAGDARWPSWPMAFGGRCQHRLWAPPLLGRVAREGRAATPPVATRLPVTELSREVWWKYTLLVEAVAVLMTLPPPCMLTRSRTRMTRSGLASCRLATMPP